VERETKRKELETTEGSAVVEVVEEDILEVLHQCVVGEVSTAEVAAVVSFEERQWLSGQEVVADRLLEILVGHQCMEDLEVMADHQCPLHRVISEENLK
jgi:hypothetical protein